jgi:nucleotide-binding universal stress UspA family protein
MPKTKVFNPSRLFRSILCPIDFSEHSARALRYAAAIAKRSDARLHAIYVNDPMLVAAAAVALNDRELVSFALAELRTFVASAVPTSRAGAAISCSVETGDPARLIALAAQRLKCDLVVMGTHGLSGVDKLLIGSTTERMLRRTSVPVLAVPPSASGAGRKSAPPRSWPGPAILVPVDLRDESERDVRDAEKIARAFGAKLVLVHVVSQFQAPPWYRADASAGSRIRVTKAQRELESLAEVVGRGVATESRVLTGNTPDEIAALAAEKRIGLIVMHLRKGPGFFGSRAGSIAVHVLRHAVTPVLALPDRAKGSL